LRSVGSLFHARGAVTEKALSPITTRLPDDKARNVDRLGISATVSAGPRSTLVCDPATTCLETGTTLEELGSHRDLS